MQGVGAAPWHGRGASKVDDDQWDRCILWPTPFRDVCGAQGSSSPAWLRHLPGHCQLRGGEPGSHRREVLARG